MRLLDLRPTGGHFESLQVSWDSPNRIRSRIGIGAGERSRRGRDATLDSRHATRIEVSVAVIGWNSMTVVRGATPIGNRNSASGSIRRFIEWNSKERITSAVAQGYCRDEPEAFTAAHQGHPAPARVNPIGRVVTRRCGSLWTLTAANVTLAVLRQFRDPLRCRCQLETTRTWC